MNTISYSELRSRLKSVLDRLATEHEPLIVTRKNASEAILMSYEDYKSLEETAYLLRSPRNAERLLRSLADASKGRLLKKKLAVSASGGKDLISFSRPMRGRIISTGKLPTKPHIASSTNLSRQYNVDRTKG